MCISNTQNKSLLLTMLAILMMCHIFLSFYGRWTLWFLDKWTCTGSKSTSFRIDCNKCSKQEICYDQLCSDLSSALTCELVRNAHLKACLSASPPCPNGIDPLAGACASTLSSLLWASQWVNAYCSAKNGVSWTRVQISIYLWVGK